MYDKWLITVISEIEQFSLLSSKLILACKAGSSYWSDSVMVIMLHFHFPTEVLQESYSHMLKWPGITANLSSKASYPALPSNNVHLLSSRLTPSVEERFSVGISLKSEHTSHHWGNLNSKRRKGLWCRKGSNSWDKSLVATAVSIQMLGLSQRG